MKILVPLTLILIISSCSGLTGKNSKMQNDDWEIINPKQAVAPDSKNTSDKELDDPINDKANNAPHSPSNNDLDFSIVNLPQPCISLSTSDGKEVNQPPLNNSTPPLSPSSNNISMEAKQDPFCLTEATFKAYSPLDSKSTSDGEEQGSFNLTEYINKSLNESSDNIDENLSLLNNFITPPLTPALNGIKDTLEENLSLLNNPPSSPHLTSSLNGSRITLEENLSLLNNSPSSPHLTSSLNGSRVTLEENLSLLNNPPSSPHLTSSLNGSRVTLEENLSLLNNPPSTPHITPSLNGSRVTLEENLSLPNNPILITISPPSLNGTSDNKEENKSLLSLMIESDANTFFSDPNQIPRDKAYRKRLMYWKNVPAYWSLFNSYSPNQKPNSNKNF